MNQTAGGATVMLAPKPKRRQKDSCKTILRVRKATTQRTSKSHERSVDDGPQRRSTGDIQELDEE